VIGRSRGRREDGWFLQGEQPFGITGAKRQGPRDGPALGSGPHFFNRAGIPRPGFGGNLSGNASGIDGERPSRLRANENVCWGAFEF